MPVKPVLTGSSIRLRPIIAGDAETMFESLKHEETNRLTGTQEKFTFEQVKAHCARVEDADDRVDYAIEAIDGQSIIIGEIVLSDIDEVNLAAGFRIALYDPQYYGRGYGTEATRLILKFAFEKLSLHRVELEVYAFNRRAAHVYEKVGFVKEGIRRDALVWGDEYVDAICMAILRPEYDQWSF